jgi:hypothetical protein
MDFAVVRCCSAEAFDAIPQSLVKVDVPSALSALAGRGWRVVADAGVVGVVEKHGVEATVYSSGRVLVKCEDAKAAEKIAKELYLDAGL